MGRFWVGPRDTSPFNEGMARRPCGVWKWKRAKPSTASFNEGMARRPCGAHPELFGGAA